MVGAGNTPPGRKDGGRLFDLHGKHPREGELGLVRAEKDQRRVLCTDFSEAAISCRRTLLEDGREGKTNNGGRDTSSA